MSAAGDGINKICCWGENKVMACQQNNTWHSAWLLQKVF